MFNIMRRGFALVAAGLCTSVHPGFPCDQQANCLSFYLRIKAATSKGKPLQTAGMDWHTSACNAGSVGVLHGKVLIYLSDMIP